MLNRVLAFTLICLSVVFIPVTAQEDATCEEGYRAVEHAMGVACVVEHPQRVVVLDTNELDSVLALGVLPVGAVEASAGGGFPAYLQPLTEGVAVVGTIAEPNLELILALQPDLILSSVPRHGEIYAQLSEIAPTVFTETLARTVWKEHLQLHAQALNREQTLALRLAEYDARVAFIQSQIPVAEIEVSIVRFTASENRMMPRGSFIGSVLSEIGFARPEPQDNDEFKIVISQEQINLLDGDVMFLSTFGNDTSVDDFLASPLWQTLSVVQNDRVYTVSDDHWFLGIGLLGANRIMDDLLVWLGDYSVE